jgi:hypothetical protein
MECWLLIKTLNNSLNVTVCDPSICKMGVNWQYLRLFLQHKMYQIRWSALKNFLKVWRISLLFWWWGWWWGAAYEYNKAFMLKMYNDHRNAQVSNLFIYLLLSYTFRDFFKHLQRQASEPGRWHHTPINISIHFIFMVLHTCVIVAFIHLYLFIYSLGSQSAAIQCRIMGP